MAQLTVKINGYAYTVGCADGQEQHLQAMAEQVESRVDRIRADELHDLKLEMAALRRARPATAEDGAFNERLSALADRAEEIAATLERH